MHLSSVERNVMENTTGSPPPIQNIGGWPYFSACSCIPTATAALQPLEIAPGITL